MLIEIKWDKNLNNLNKYYHTFLPDDEKSSFSKRKLRRRKVSLQSNSYIWHYTMSSFIAIFGANLFETTNSPSALEHFRRKAALPSGTVLNCPKVCNISLTERPWILLFVYDIAMRSKLSYSMWISVLEWINIVWFVTIFVFDIHMIFF